MGITDIVQSVAGRAGDLAQGLRELPEQGTNFLRDGYLFQKRLRERRGLPEGDSSPQALRMMGTPALLVRGREGVELFYDDTRVKRQGAMPLPVRGPLFGAGAVHGLDDAEHRHRKQTMISITYDDEQVRRFMPVIEAEVAKVARDWTTQEASVYDSAVLAYGRAALRWAGIPGDDAELDPWAQRLGQIVDGFGKKGPQHAVAWANRMRCDAWAKDLITRTRSGEITPEPGTALAVLAAATNLDGSLLDAHTAGVELQNCTRPTIAVSRFAAFAARALVEHPQYRERINAETRERDSLLEGPLAVAFSHEVRRVYPFVPMLPAFARKDFTFQGQQVHEGDRVLIDILGTNNDPSEWDDPATFRPERFLDRDAEQIEAFIPQGGSSVYTGHRCPGEKIATTALSCTIAALCSDRVRIRPHGLDFDWTTLPTRPAAGPVVGPA